MERSLTRRSALGGMAALTALPALGADLVRGETGVVAAVTDGDTFTLRSGTRVKLASVVTPARAETWGREAHEGLAGLLRGRVVTLRHGGDRLDRYGRAHAQVFTVAANGTPDLWVQEEVVRLGLARVFTWPEEVVDAPALLAMETRARQRARGLWSAPGFGVMSPEPNGLAQKVDSLQIVEGVVTATAEVRGRAYLNFGADYKTDFTVAIARKHRKRFAALDPLSLAGARVRVRGWVEMINGPMIWANHPERIEVLG